MHKYDYSFLKKSIPGNMIGLTNVIADLNSKEAFRKLQYEETFEVLRRNAVINSVKGSNAIEGIVTADSRIRDIVAGAEPLTHDEKEISGYKNALDLIHTEHDRLDLNEELIQTLHRLIEEETNSREAGQYKRTDNYIIEYGMDGTRRIRFRPVSADSVQKDMEQLMLAYYDARQDSSIPSLLLIPCVILDFLCIHPFTDGNGRVSRLMTVLLLYLSGYDIARYISYEGMVNNYKEEYYAALEASSVSWHENENDYVPFIINFLQMLYRCYKELDSTFTELSLRKARKSERVESILLNAIVPISKHEILQKLPDISVQTVEAVVARLLKENRIRKIGTYRDARYTRVNQPIR